MGFFDTGFSTGDTSSSQIVQDVLKSLFIPGFGLKNSYDAAKLGVNTAKKGAESMANNFMNGLNVIGSGLKKGYNSALDFVGRVSDGVEEASNKILNGLKENWADPNSPWRSSGGSGGGSGGFSGGNGVISGAMSGYDSYLDMLHQEQERVWQREDTAYQRTVKDMQAAGLNPVLAVNHGVSASGGSGSSDSQVVGAVADLAAMAIGGLTETARGAMQLSQMTSVSPLQKFGSWYKSNAKTINTAISSAAGLAKLIAMI